jgi:hypothetical protein
VVDRGWKRPFEEPISLPRGRQLVTLEDAGNYITKLPKAEHEAPEWRDAMECLMSVAEKNGPTMMARIGIMRTLAAGLPHAFGARSHRQARGVSGSFRSRMSRQPSGAI